MQVRVIVKKGYSFCERRASCETLLAWQVLQTSSHVCLQAAIVVRLTKTIQTHITRATFVLRYDFYQNK